MLAFLGGALPMDARATVEEHIATCDACADLVTWAAADQATSTTRLPGHEGRPFVGELHAGARVGRYQILNPIGRGGMGEVYAAYHPDLDRRIALKVVHGLDGSSGERRKRLLREARAIARLSHPNVITVHDAGALGERVFIAMELIDGQTIDQWLRAEARTWQEVLDVFMAAGRGLAAAHAAGVVHRDFKPDNVMIARNGAVRVMDFGLARVEEEDSGGGGGDRRASPAEDDPTRPLTFVTKTGAIVGTPAYMSPEQFRHERADERSDQFSFCVALHEALFGVRPPAATPALAGELTGDERAPPAPRPGVPAWLRAVVLRGASVDREQRYASMQELLAALESGRTEPRRRVSAIAVGVAAAVLIAGAWRLGHGNRVDCAAPRDRIAAVWAPAAAGDARRQAIHRAFAASGRATAEMSWQRLSKVLDDYMNAWAASYVDTCEATHVRGEQSGEVLDLRMSCLADGMDQVRALTDALANADAPVVSRAVTAASELTPVKRCADVAMLKSAVPLPKDDRTLREVRAIQPAMRDLQVFRDTGNSREILARALALRPRVEAIGYRPLLAELLELIGFARVYADAGVADAEATLREAMVTAEACHDDVVAAKAALALSYVLGYREGRIKDAEFILQLANAFLDRIEPANERLRSWAMADEAIFHLRQGDFDRARSLSEASVALREKVLGPDHPDVAIGLGQLSFMLADAGQPEPALAAANRAIDIFTKHGDPDGFQLAVILANQCDALNALARYADAEKSCNSSIRIFYQQQPNPPHPESAYPFRGLGESKLGQSQPAAAIDFLRNALHICAPDRCDQVLVADTNFALARALWDSGGDRTKAHALTTAAIASFETGHRPTRARAVEAWLEGHRRR